MADMYDMTRGLGPVAGAVLAILLIILGILVIIQPALLTWIAGIGLILAGVALIVGMFVPQRMAG
jgi:uncharacterized membrane protein HdeD (DUF308 family)